MKHCKTCGQVMVDAGHYDPEGTVPLVLEIEESGRVWACLNCSEKIDISRDV